MVYRVLSPVLMGLAAVGLAAVARADHKGHGMSGYVVKVEGGKLTMAGKDKKEHSHDVAKDAEVTLNGKKAKLEDLKERNHVIVTMDDKHTATKVEAHSMAMDGHVVRVEGGKLTMTGRDKKEHSHDLAKDVTVLVDGKKAKLEDLKPHAHVIAMMDDKHTVLKIAGHTHDEKK
jgi:hypothetical protein